LNNTSKIIELKKNKVKYQSKLILIKDLFNLIIYKINSKFDFIISNPPYIKEEYKITMQKDVLLYEDHEALFSGDDGLSLIRKIIENSRSLVKKNGFVILEIDEDQTYKLIDLMIVNKFNKFFTEKDIFGKARFFIYFIN